MGKKAQKSQGWGVKKLMAPLFKRGRWVQASAEQKREIFNWMSDYIKPDWSLQYQKATRKKGWYIEIYEGDLVQDNFLSAFNQLRLVCALNQMQIRKAFLSSKMNHLKSS